MTTETSKAYHEVAKTIQQQMGGSKLFAVGAKNLMSSEDQLGALSFKFMKTERTKANYVKITLAYDDTYIVEFGRVYGNKYTSIETFKNVYCDQLISLFEDFTGLYINIF